MLLDTQADIVRWLLVALGLGTDPLLNGVWPAYATKEPNTPDNVLTVYGTEGQDDGRSMVDGELFYHYGFQVRVRSTDRAGFLKASQIRNALAKQVYLTVVTVNSNNYLVHCVSKIGSVLELGEDRPNSTRRVFTINAKIAVRSN